MDKLFEEISIKNKVRPAELKGLKDVIKNLKFKIRSDTHTLDISKYDLKNSGELVDEIAEYVRIKLEFDSFKQNSEVLENFNEAVEEISRKINNEFRSKSNPKNSSEETQKTREVKYHKSNKSQAEMNLLPLKNYKNEIAISQVVARLNRGKQRTSRTTSPRDKRGGKELESELQEEEDLKEKENIKNGLRRDSLKEFRGMFSLGRQVIKTHPDPYIENEIHSNVNLEDERTPFKARAISEYEKKSAEEENDLLCYEDLMAEDETLDIEQRVSYDLRNEFNEEI